MSAILLFGVVTIGQAQNSPAQDPYTPKLRIVETNDFTGKPGIAYRFTGEQLARMAHTKLETNRFVAYIDHRWPAERLQAYCVATNVMPEGDQNLVAETCPIETDLYKGEANGFDRIWVYVSEDDGPGTYFEDAGRKWHRWTYSLNIERGNSHWAIIEELPNDFMDSGKFGVSEQDGAANGSQPIRSETNGTSSAAGSRR